MPSRTTTNYVGRAMTEMEIKQANKTTMFVLGGLRRPKEAWIVAAQAQKEKEDARQRRSNQRKIPFPTEAPNAKRYRKSALSQEEKDRKLQEQRSRYNQKRREARAELRKKRQSMKEQKAPDKQPKATQPSIANLDIEEISTAHWKSLEQEKSMRHQPLKKHPADTTENVGENNCTDEELADLIAAEFDDVSDNEEHTSTKDNCEEDNAEPINSEFGGGMVDSTRERFDENERILSCAPEFGGDAIDESSEESEEE